MMDMQKSAKAATLSFLGGCRGSIDGSPFALNGTIGGSGEANAFATLLGGGAQQPSSGRQDVFGVAGAL